jgi:hypothetical protein
VDNSRNLCKSSLGWVFVSGEPGQVISPCSEALPTSSDGTFTNLPAT